MVNFLSDFVPIIFVGISLGSLFGLVGLAYTCIVNSTQLVNFGQGDFCMVGVFAAWFVMSVLGLPLWLGFIVAIAAGILMGIITERILVTPLMQKDAAPFFSDYRYDGNRSDCSRCCRHLHQILLDAD